MFPFKSWLRNFADWKFMGNEIIVSRTDKYHEFADESCGSANKDTGKSSVVCSEPSRCVKSVDASNNPNADGACNGDPSTPIARLELLASDSRDSSSSGYLFGGIPHFFIDKRRKNEARIQAYHREIIKVYEEWLATKVEPRRTSDGSHESRYSKGYIDMNLDMEKQQEMTERVGEVGLLMAVGTMDTWLWSDAVEHLGEISGAEWANDANKCREALMNDVTVHNGNFSALVRWQNEIATTKLNDIGLTESKESSSLMRGNPADESCNVVNLLEYFDRHFHLGEKAELIKISDSPTGVTILRVIYSDGGVLGIAQSKDILKISRLVGNIDDWGQTYAKWMKVIDTGITTIKTKLERFHYYLRTIIRRMQYFPHTLKHKCSIEKSVSRKD